MKELMKSYNNTGNLKVYLAGPFFNDEQINRINFIEDLLDSYNFDIFSPRQASLIKPGCTEDDMRKTFYGNTTNIDNADFVLAILDGNDTGTMFECGYAYAKNKPVLYFNETRNKNKGPNLMLAMSTEFPYLIDNTAKDQLKNILIKLNKFGLDYTKINLKTTKFSEVE